MAGAWAEGYWLSYTLSGNPGLSFRIIPTGSGQTIWPWKVLDSSLRFDVIKHQLQSRNIYVQWNNSSKEITKIVTLKDF